MNSLKSYPPFPRLLHLLLFLITLVISIQGFAQDREKKIDSLKQIIETTENDTIRIKAYLDWDNLIYSSDPNLDKEINHTVSHLCEEKLNARDQLTPAEVYFYKKYLGTALNNLAIIYKNRGQLDSALDLNLQSLEIKKEINDKKGIGNSYVNLGGIYHTQGNLIKALDYYFKCQDIREEIGDQKGVSGILINIGAIYHYQDDYTNALKYYEQSLKMKLELGDKTGSAISYSNIGTVYVEQGDSASKKGNTATATKKYHDALEHYERSLEINLINDNKNAIAKDYNNIGTVYFKTGDLDTALVYFSKCAEIRLSYNLKQGLSSAYSNIANIYLEKKQYNKALEYGNKGYELAKETNSIIEINTAASLLYKTYKALQKPSQALQMYEEYVASKDSITSRESSLQTIHLQYKYDYDKKAAADSVANEKSQEIKDIEIAKQEAELEARRNEQIALYGGLFLLIIFAIFIYNRFKVTSRQKEIIEHQKEVVEEKQKEILDSINYAKRIQNAILPPQRIVKEYLQNSFILYKPKDIVAGDFYWLEYKNEKVLFAAADCTGHGVPGAMVSVVCNNGLNRSVREHGITNPGKILDKTREIVIQEFEKSDDEVKDGMDISICSLSLSTLTLEWAGANNPLWIIRNFELTEYKPDKQPIGKLENPQPFKSHSIQLEKGDAIYIFTDGLQDQFGGDKGKKFRASQLKEILIKNQTKSMDEQKQIIDDAFENWKGSLEQVDDVCIIGLRV
jgi:serine phosphatase RsbU (regulator of sigma subunit)